MEAYKGKVLVAAHRGTSGGNIIQNTIPAYENALKQGADILEVDVAMSTDGDLFVFHTGQEPGVLGTGKRLDSMCTGEIKQFSLINSMQEQTGQKIECLQDVLEHFKGRCLINIDRAWFYWEQVISFLGKQGMDDQIILKSPPEPALLDGLHSIGPNIMYMPIIRARDQLDRVLASPVNTVAAEIIFEDDTNLLAQPPFIQEMHKKGLLLWVNAITLDDKTRLSGGHDDNKSILEDMASGWGWLVDRGFDMIQTDWPMLLRAYLNEKSGGTV